MGDLRQRILAAAYPLFVHPGIHDVALDEVAEAADLTLGQLAQEFPSRDELAAECLKVWEREWTLAVVEAGARASSSSPEGRLLAIFDVLDDWFHRDDHEACTFINVLLEMGREHPLGPVSARRPANIRALVKGLAAEAELRDPDEFALSWHILMKGSIINAVEGDQQAASRAKAMGADLIARHREPQRRLSHRNVDWFDQPPAPPQPAAHSPADAAPAAARPTQQRLLDLIVRNRVLDQTEFTDDDADWL